MILLGERLCSCSMNPYTIIRLSASLVTAAPITSARARPPAGTMERWASTLAAATTRRDDGTEVFGTLGSIAGMVAGGCLALLAARLVGIDQSIADYGPAYRITLAGVWAGGLIGCYIALRKTHDSLSVPTVVCLGVLLALRASVASYDGESGPGWASPGRILIYGALYVLVPIAAPLLACLLAGLARRSTPRRVTEP